MSVNEHVNNGNVNKQEIKEMKARIKASPDQITYLIDFMKQHADMASNVVGHSLPDRANHQQKWEKLTRELNSLGGVMKTTLKWRRAWYGIRNYGKKNGRIIIEEDPSALCEMSPNEEINTTTGPVAVIKMEVVATEVVESEEIVEETSSVVPKEEPECNNFLPSTGEPVMGVEDWCIDSPMEDRATPEPVASPASSTHHQSTIDYIPTEPVASPGSSCHQQSTTDYTPTEPVASPGSSIHHQSTTDYIFTEPVASPGSSIHHQSTTDYIPTEPVNSPRSSTHCQSTTDYTPHPQKRTHTPLEEYLLASEKRRQENERETRKLQGEIEREKLRQRDIELRHRDVELRHRDIELRHLDEELRHRSVKLKQRDRELMLQAQWVQVAKTGLSVLEKYINDRK